MRSEENKGPYLNRHYYPLLFRLDGIKRWLIWYSEVDDKQTDDGVLVDQKKHIVTFETHATLTSYAEQQGIILIEESGGVDLDVVKEWLRASDASTVNCAQFLDAWNLFADVCSTIEVPLRDRDAKAQKVYDKLFWGSNLPGVTPQDHYYDPVWTASDLHRLRQILSHGLHIFRLQIELQK